MKEEELKMLRQFVDTVFTLTHSMETCKSPKGKENLLFTIGDLAYSVMQISSLYKEEEHFKDEEQVG